MLLLQEMQQKMHSLIMIERIKANVKILVLDEMHKMFDRNSDFEGSYEFFNRIKDGFSSVPVMTLTATLSQAQLQICVFII